MRLSSGIVIVIGQNSVVSIIYIGALCHRVIKKASLHAGVKEKKVVLLVEEAVSKSAECMDDVCSLIREGACLSVFSFYQYGVRNDA